MKLTQLTLSNFQGIRKLTLSFPDGCSASIWGDNGTGKTTVYNSLTWLLFDKSSTGVKNFSPKTRDSKGEVHNIENTVEGVFVNELTGTTITLRKTLKEVYRRKRGSISEDFEGNTTDYYINGVPAKANEYNRTIEEKFGDAEAIKALTMPNYFPEQLDWQSRRKLLIDTCGDITDEQVIREHEDLEELKSYLGQYTVDDYRKIAKAKMTEINKQLQTLPARIDEVMAMIEALPVSDQSEEELRDRARILEQKKFEVVDTEDEQTKLEVLNKNRITAIQKLATAQRAYDDAFAEKKRMFEEMRKEYDTSSLELNKRRIEYDLRMAQDELEIVIKRRARLAEEYNKEKDSPEDVSDICVTCGQKLPPEKVESARQAVRKAKADRLSKIADDVQSQASKALIDKLQRKIDEIKILLTQTVRDIEANEHKLSTLPVLPEQESFETTEEYKTIDSEMQTIDSAIKETRSAIEAKRQEAVDYLRPINDELEQIQTALKAYENKALYQNRVNQLESQEKNLATEYTKLERGMYLCDQFTIAKMEMLDENINRLFTKVKFRMYQEQINGGIKDDCEVMIPLPDGRLIPYGYANNAARITAGLEIINCLSAVYGRTMPIIMDNAEAVTHLEKPENLQVIRLVVSASDKTLRLELE